MNDNDQNVDKVQLTIDLQVGLGYNYITHQEEQEMLELIWNNIL